MPGPNWAPDPLTANLGLSRRARSQVALENSSKQLLAHTITDLSFCQCLKQKQSVGGWEKFPSASIKDQCLISNCQIDYLCEHNPTHMWSHHFQWPESPDANWPTTVHWSRPQINRYQLIRTRRCCHTLHQWSKPNTSYQNHVTNRKHLNRITHTHEPYHDHLTHNDPE